LLLEEKAPVYQYRLVEIPKYLLDEVGVSSTKIRKAILSSDVDTANKLLGYDFYFTGRVIKGDQLGRELGYPTANLEYEDSDKIHLGEGVFVCQVEIKEQIKTGMLSIGTRPTVSGKEERVEVNILDFDADLYGQELKVTVKKFLRSQEKYANLEELKKQMARDQENTIQYFQSANKKIS
jgi:riboflavin kinase/FMN adenylyltransferase